MKVNDLKKYKLPGKPGVYFFIRKTKGKPPLLAKERVGGEVLYIGKATSLRDRVRSYFGKDLIATRGPMILDMVVQADRIKWQETDSVLEALILEANLIKKYQPKYNTKEKDNKSFNYVCITDEKIPKILVVRGRNLNGLPLNKGEERGGGEFEFIFGPFPNGLQLKEALKIIRKIFPYIDEQSNKKNNIEFYKQLGLIPKIISQKNYFQKVLGSPSPQIRGVWPDHFGKDFSASLNAYKNNIKNIKLFFQGKKKSIVVNLKKEMAAFSKSKDFENAAKVRNQIFALNHINDVALIKEENFERSFLARNEKGESLQNLRIESYYIAHMSGKNMVGVMTFMTDGEINKSEYKKFIIRTQDNANDTGALEEVLSRRFHHTEWGLPNLIVVDGSTAQVNVAKRVLIRYHFDIPVVSVIKDDKHKAKALMGDEEIIKKNKKDILLANSEAHRFAITFHKKRRGQIFLI